VRFALQTAVLHSLKIFIGLHSVVLCSTVVYSVVLCSILCCPVLYSALYCAAQCFTVLCSLHYLFMVGLNSCSVLHHAEVGDQAAGKHLEK
jgi:hypothetical protein